ncbi:MAG: LacI family transcriptional regulator [Bifidobacteriaceae bacterium]|nr:LacI family transcriptional regulator [Bifidobacteriaceae bacterium]
MAQLRMKDVAEKAGVSISTVSHVINTPEVVAAETIARVRRAMDEIGFVPNAAARQLKLGTSSTIGMVVTDISEPFWAELARAVETHAEAQGLSVLLADSNFSAQRESTHLDFFAYQRVKGILLAPVGVGMDALAPLVKRGTPAVVFGQGPPGLPFPSVSHDDIAGGRLAVRHLTSLGRKRLAFLGGPLSLPPISNRLQGAAEVAQEAQADLRVLPTTDMSFAEGYRVGAELTARGPQHMPDGVLAATDLLALGFIKALHIDGAVRIPEQLAVIGYGDISFAANSLLPLASVRQPNSAIAAAAVKLLLDQFDGHKPAGQSLFPPELVIRESAAPGRPILDTTHQGG